MTVGYVELDEVTREMASGSGSVHLPEGYHDIIERMIVQASALADRYKRVQRGAYLTDISDDALTQRTVVNVAGRPSLLFDFCLRVTEIAERRGSEWRALVEGEDYDLWPYNAIQLEEAYRRADWLSAVRPGVIRVTASWGVTETPPDGVQRAVLITVQQWWSRALQGWQDTGAIPELHQLRYTKSLDPTVTKLLDMEFPHKLGFHR